MSPSNMSEVKDLVQLAVWIFGILSVVIGLVKARQQRIAELKWKRANIAKELLDDIHKDVRAASAVRMLDWCTDEDPQKYEASGHLESISYPEVLAALAKNGRGEKKSDKDSYIRDCFDWFFYRVDRIEHYIRRELLDFQDVKAVFKVYADEIDRHRDVYEGFFCFHQYELARNFFLRDFTNGAEKSPA
jgi:hypothetical protein